MAMMEAMVRELEGRMSGRELRGRGDREEAVVADGSPSAQSGLRRLETLYLGGGTPSLLEEEELQCLLDGLGRWYSMDGMEEFTLEVNPEDVDLPRLAMWKRLGVNRLSMGVQSFDAAFLRGMNRSHGVKDSLNALELIASEGHWALSADLIYGFPEQSIEAFQKDLRTLLTLGVPHISAYQLTREPRTVLDHWMHQGKVDLPPDQSVLDQMRCLYETCSEWGYEAYELSNLALPGHRAVHNSRYWSGHPYTGLGPSAHSFDGHRIRSWNIAHNARYVDKVNRQEPYFECEYLSEADRFNEFLMIQLRLDQGIAWEDLLGRFGEGRLARLRTDLGQQTEDSFDLDLEGFLSGNPGSRLRLSMSGRGWADRIAASLFQDEVI
jgi:oxygen-independent coproporphyrinogen-3 oxidase